MREGLTGRSSRYIQRGKIASGTARRLADEMSEDRRCTATLPRSFNLVKLPVATAGMHSVWCTLRAKAEPVTSFFFAFRMQEQLPGSQDCQFHPENGI